ncbi:hypothetical protein EH228_04615 [Erwinia endophytica]|uniref:hypothetical protein n=1 Tax=Erwinia endophytica TaxID=1563158 RepID=UPI0012660688|nr:hypothetical protein [Erwinia endophytica]KAB8312964.1 hypothetical protein EH228_04615 [Erwinia endophytica]
MDKIYFEFAKKSSINKSREEGAFSFFQYNLSAEMAITEIASQLKIEDAEIFDKNQAEHIRAVLSIALKMIS